MTAGRESVKKADVPTRVRRAIRSHAEEEPGREICGLLLGRRSGGRVEVDDLERCTNQAPEEDRHRRFVIDPLRVLEAERDHRSAERSVVGFYHSHPHSAPRPSPEDRSYMKLWPKTLWLILGAVADGEPGAECAGFRGWTTNRYGVEEIREVGLESR